MRIVTTRRISQIFFFLLFIWFCIAATVGSKFWQIRGWPVAWFFELDPLVAIGTVLATHTLYRPLLWALVTVVLTIVFGRFFCGWICPFGSLHQFVGFLGRHNKKTAQKIQLNKYRKAQKIKYYILAAVLVMAAFPSAAATLQIGLLDPIAVITRSFNLVLLPIADGTTNFITIPGRFYEGAWLVFAIFLAAVLLNLVIPRFYCRFICPLGALFGVIDRFAIWRIGKRQFVLRSTTENGAECINCKLCERDCEGGCEPAGNIRISECVLCFNCLDGCRHNVIAYQPIVSAAGEVTNPDISRRGFALSLVSGLSAVGAVRLANKIGSNWYYKVVRPPGALPEKEFLKRCVKCGQCMRICPTNVIQPAGFEGGLENLWTPVLNNRIGSSGCQLNCVACGQVCPTAAIRPITLAEKLGVNEFTEAGPIKMGTAFIDRSRCLPWAMDKPCIVCEENCPLSPKAIFTRVEFVTIREGVLTVKELAGDTIQIAQGNLTPGKFAGGDYYCAEDGGRRWKILANSDSSLSVSGDEPLEEVVKEGQIIEIQVRLQRPYVDIEKCIGCGVCEHECPVSGRKAIRVSAEGETRSTGRTLLLKR